MLTYRTGSLFDAPEGSYIGHACNCMGRWGSGIAAQFAELYPQAYKAYNAICQASRENLRGDCAIIPAPDRQIVCLFTSVGYGTRVDPPEDILVATEAALFSLTRQVPEHTVIHLPKINSDLFKVPWEKTEEVLKAQRFLDFEIWVRP